MTKQVLKAETVAAKLAAAFDAAQNNPERDDATRINIAKIARKINFAAVGEFLHGMQFDKAATDKLCAFVEKNNIKAVNRIPNIIAAAALNRADALNSSTRAVLQNMSKHGALNNRETAAALCVGLELETTRALRGRKHQTESTSAAQRSSVTNALFALSIVDYQPGVRNAEATLNDSPLAARVREMFSAD